MHEIIPNQGPEKIYFLVHLYTILSGIQTRGDAHGNHQTRSVPHVQG
jgi:hypothetical protein